MPVPAPDSVFLPVPAVTNSASPSPSLPSCLLDLPAPPLSDAAPVPALDAEDDCDCHGWAHPWAAGPLLVLVLVQYTTSKALVQNNRQSLLVKPSHQYRKRTRIVCICRLPSARYRGLLVVVSSQNSDE